MYLGQHLHQKLELQCPQYCVRRQLKRWKGLLAMKKTLKSTLLVITFFGLFVFVGAEESWSKNSRILENYFLFLSIQDHISIKSAEHDVQNAIDAYPRDSSERVTLVEQLASVWIDQKTNSITAESTARILWQHQAIYYQSVT